MPTDPPITSPAPREASPILLPTTTSDPLHAAYFNASDPGHRTAVDQVRARFEAAYPPTDPTWSADALENPSPGDHKAPYVLASPHPERGPWAPADAQAVSNVFDSIAGRKDLAQQALDFIEDGPADRLPDPPSSYRPPDVHQTVATLKRGWGDAYDDNLKSARAVVDVYEVKKGGGLREYLERTGLGNDARLIRLAARTGRQWLKAGWRP